MSGECTSYRLNEPMTWAEFNAMPDDLKITYINLIRQKWSVPISRIGEMMGVAQTVIQRETARLGLTFGKGASHKKWDKDGFYSWIARSNGVGAENNDTAAEEPVEEAVDTTAVEDDRVIRIDPDKFFTLRLDDVDHMTKSPETAVPDHGDMTFKCPANMALETIKQILANENVEIRVSWRVIDGDVC